MLQQINQTSPSSYNNITEAAITKLNATFNLLSNTLSNATALAQTLEQAARAQLVSANLQHENVTQLMEEYKSLTGEFTNFTIATDVYNMVGEMYIRLVKKTNEIKVNEMSIFSCLCEPFANLF